MSKINVSVDCVIFGFDDAEKTKSFELEKKEIHFQIKNTKKHNLQFQVILLNLTKILMMPQLEFFLA